LAGVGGRRRVTEVALREFLLAVVAGVRQQVLKCIEYGVTCRDVPAVTSTFLRRTLGFSDFRVRRFWSLATRFAKRTYVIYEHGDAKYWLLPEVHRSFLFATPNYDFFMDVFDRREHFRGRCVELTNVPSLYIYLVGRVENDVIKINALYLLSLIARKRPDCFERLMGFAESLARGSGGEADFQGIVECVADLLSSWGYLKVFVPFIPATIEALLIKCPFLREIFTNREG